MPPESFADRPNIPSPDGSAQNIRLARYMVTKEGTAGQPGRMVLSFKGAPKDITKAMGIINYHGGEEHEELAIRAALNEPKGTLEITARKQDKHSLSTLVEFVQKHTGCDLGLSFRSTHMDSIKTTDKGMVRKHVYFPLVNISLADKELAENIELANGVMGAVMPRLERFARDNNDYPHLKISRERDFGEILVQDRQKSESQAMALNEARTLADSLKALFPEAMRSKS